MLEITRIWGIEGLRRFVTGKRSFKNPAIWINKKLAYELGWFEHDPDEQDPQFAVKLGPNLCIKTNGYEIPRTHDIKSNFTTKGHAQSVTHSDKYSIIPR